MMAYHLLYCLSGLLVPNVIFDAFVRKKGVVHKIEKTIAYNQNLGVVMTSQNVYSNSNIYLN
jgi:hypothetical protein